MGGWGAWGEPYGWRGGLEYGSEEKITFHPDGVNCANRKRPASSSHRAHLYPRVVNQPRWFLRTHSASDEKMLLAPFPLLARAGSSRGALKSALTANQTRPLRNAPARFFQLTLNQNTANKVFIETSRLNRLRKSRRFTDPVYPLSQ